MGDDMLTRTSSVLIAFLLAAALAVSASSLRSGESLVVLIVLSLGLWEGLYLMTYWLAAALLSP
jgi:hypothetical protein